MSTMKVVGGIVAGALIGSAVALISDPGCGRARRKLWRGGANMMKAVGSALDSMAYLRR